MQGPRGASCLVFLCAPPHGSFDGAFSVTNAVASSLLPILCSARLVLQRDAEMRVGDGNEFGSKSRRDELRLTVRRVGFFDQRRRRRSITYPAPRRSRRTSRRARDRIFEWRRSAPAPRAPSARRTCAEHLRHVGQPLEFGNLPSFLETIFTLHQRDAGRCWFRIEKTLTWHRSSHHRHLSI